jgi:hypothetical protein
MNHSSSSGPTWRSSRTRDRNKARFLIRSHIAAECREEEEKEGGQGVHPSESKSLLLVQSSYTATTDDNHNDQDDAVLRNIFKAASDGNTSYFSLKCIAENYNDISYPQPCEYLSRYKVTTLCTSRFGDEYTKAALYYRQHKGSFTLVEYASIIGEYGIVGSLIKGGINPLPLESLSFGSQQRRERVSKLVLRRLVANIHLPKTLAVYIIKSIYVMKMWSFYHGHNDYETNCESKSCPSEQEQQVCPICQEDLSPLITFIGGCNHSCCELCHWQIAVTKLDERHEGDVFQCPICGQTCSPSNAATSKDDEDEYKGKDPTQRCLLSLERFHALPESGEELRRMKRPPKKKNKIYSSWAAALEASCGQSKNVRRDKFMRYVSTGAIHHCRACLRAGVDVNHSNEFKQSELEYLFPFVQQLQELVIDTLLNVSNVRHFLFLINLS